MYCLLYVLVYFYLGPEKKNKRIQNGESEEIQTGTNSRRGGFETRYDEDGNNEQDEPARRHEFMSTLNEKALNFTKCSPCENS